MKQMVNQIEQKLPIHSFNKHLVDTTMIQVPLQRLNVTTPRHFRLWSPTLTPGNKAWHANDIGDKGKTKHSNTLSP